MAINPGKITTLTSNLLVLLLVAASTLVAAQTALPVNHLARVVP